MDSGRASNRRIYAQVSKRSLLVFQRGVGDRVVRRSGGTAYAVGKNSVGNKQLKNGAVGTAKIKDGAVSTAKIQNGAVSTGKIQNGAVTGAKVGPITTVSATSGPFAPVTTGSVFVQCPAGTVLLSGGGAPQNAQVYTQLSRKSDPNGWRYDAFNGGTVNSTITVFAYCLAG